MASYCSGQQIFQIKAIEVEEKRFNLRGESEKSIDFVAKLHAFENREI